MKRPCQPFTGSIDPTTGYGYWWTPKVDGKRRKIYAHRDSYERNVGPIPTGYQVDHLCGVRACIEPTHLEAVTSDENKRRVRERRTHCGNGHRWTERNTFIAKRGDRQCLDCRPIYAARRKEKAAA